MSGTEMVGWLLAIWGEVLAELGDLDGALCQAKKGIALTEKGSDVAMLTWSYMCLTRVLFSRGDFYAAHEIITATERIARASVVPRWVTNLMGAWKVRTWLAQDKLDETLEWMRQRWQNLDAQTTYVDALDNVALARVFMAQERHEDAVRLLNRLLEPAEAGAHTTRAIQILILQALALQAQGDTDQAMASLERALALAEPGGYIRIFADEGPAMARLLYEALARRIGPDYVRRLLAAFPVAEAEPPTSSVADHPSSALIEPLSERELEVLALIAQGLTNLEIASRLFLALNTVKAHASNIYGKLGVHNRMEAAARARALGILPPT
jgi:LuxR family maltose regulon positive regulatory protein